MRIAYLKWILTWSLALLPLIFHFCKQFFTTIHVPLDEVCGNGELFLVSIVVVGEPFSRLIIAKVNPATTLGYVISSLMLLLFCTYMYALIDLSPEMSSICSAESQTVESNSGVSTIKAKEIEKIRQIKTMKISVSLSTFAAALIIGGFAVYHTHKNGHH
ncbi:hypothetical protein [Taibaiella soli]|nr:hypothetical protein [Taibaiella soli]